MARAAALAGGDVRAGRGAHLRLVTSLARAAGDPFPSEPELAASWRRAVAIGGRGLGPWGALAEVADPYVRRIAEGRARPGASPAERRAAYRRASDRLLEVLVSPRGHLREAREIPLGGARWSPRRASAPR